MDDKTSDAITSLVDAETRMRQRLTKHAEIRAETDDRATACNWCGKPLRRDNVSGWCQKHRNSRGRLKCRCLGCRRQVNHNNASGYCKVHKIKTKRCTDTARAIMKGYKE